MLLSPTTHFGEHYFLAYDTGTLLPHSRIIVAGSEKGLAGCVANAVERFKAGSHSNGVSILGCWKGIIIGPSKEMVDGWFKRFRENELNCFPINNAIILQLHYYYCGYWPDQVRQCDDCVVPSHAEYCWDTECETCDGHSFLLKHTTWEELFDLHNLGLKDSFPTPSSDKTAFPLYLIVQDRWNEGIEVEMIKGVDDFIEKAPEPKRLLGIFQGEPIKIPGVVLETIHNQAKKLESTDDELIRKHDELKRRNMDEAAKSVEKFFSVLPRSKR